MRLRALAMVALREGVVAGDVQFLFKRGTGQLAGGARTRATVRLVVVVLVVDAEEGEGRRADRPAARRVGRSFMFFFFPFAVGLLIWSWNAVGGGVLLRLYNDLRRHDWVGRHDGARCRLW